MAPEEDSAVRIYLDACCVNRPYDRQQQIRVRLETEAVLYIVSRLLEGFWTWVSSEVLEDEVGKNPNVKRRQDLEELVAQAAMHVEVTLEDLERSEELRSLGFGAMDALHIACAERAGVTVFLTTDDRLLRNGQRQHRRLRLRVANPLAWLGEVTTWRRQ